MTPIGRWLYRASAGLKAREIRIDGARYMERHVVAKAFGVTAYLHRYLNADDERQIHDHPWRWSLGIVLTGGYTEERLTGFDPARGWLSKLRTVRPFVPNLITARTFHRIVAVKPGTWTLFLHGRRMKGWGFLQPFDVERFEAWTERAVPARELRAALGESS